jgi:hypothetical protein
VVDRDRFVLEVSREGTLWEVRVRGTEWRTQTRSEAHIEEMARDLIALNAGRSDTQDFDVEIRATR